MLHEQIEDVVRPLAPVVDIPHDVQAVHGQPLDEGAEALDDLLRPVDIDNGGDDVLVIGLLVLLVVVGMEQLVQNIAEGLGHSLAHLGTGVFGGHQLANLHQPVEGDAVPIVHIDGVPLDFLHLFLGVIDKGGEPGPLLFRHGMSENHVHLFPDDAGSVVENMAEGLILAMEVAHEMLGALGQVAYGVQVNDLGADGRDVRVLLGQQLKIILLAAQLLILQAHGGPPFRQLQARRARRAAVLSVFSHDTPKSSRPMWP